ncbi:MAG: methylenetetrahydrofolate--tRNA-(uracil(54)-C(5))-methyltransferase (FADH(2)-oxidizing) TrmFO, partial [Candidatus Izemoplasmataceae bacterium]
MMKTVTIIGAGLAGSEAAYQLAKRGFKVRLHEMRPVKMTPAHHTNHFAELVCSNSLRGNHLNQAVGVMKEEMRMLDSLIIKMADIHQVPAGSALAVDREGFSKAVTDYLSHHDNIEIVHEEVSKLPEGPVIIATGPLTSDALMAEIKTLIDEDTLYFFDAAAPIIDADSIDMDICYKKSRYDKGTADYINCPMNKEQYERFYHELINAECTEVKTFELKVFEGCMPIEEMARRGIKTMLFGPLKPVGLAQD